MKSDVWLNVWAITVKMFAPVDDDGGGGGDGGDDDGGGDVMVVIREKKSVWGQMLAKLLVKHKVLPNQGDLS